MSIKSIINIRALKAAAFATSTEATRYYLNGVYFRSTDKVARYVATNGHIMIVLRDDRRVIDDKDDTSQTLSPIDGIIIPSATIKSLKVAKHTDYGVITFEEDRSSPDYLSFVIDYNGAKVGGKLIDGTFPDYARVIPRGPYKNTPCWFDAKYLWAFQQAGAVLNSVSISPRIAAVAYNGPENPALVDFVPQLSEIEGFGVIMPVRVPSVIASPPAWLDDDFKPATTTKTKEPA